MTISANNRMDNVGNGAADTYSYNFKIFAATDLRVTVRDTDDVETTLTYPTHYTVTGVGLAAGGNVALVNGGFSWLDGDGDLKTGYALTIRRVRPLTQTTDIRNQESYHADVHEAAFDHFVMIDQQQQDEIDRSIKISESFDPDGFDTTLPAPVPATLIGWNTDGDGLQNYTAADLATVSLSVGNYAVDHYDAGADFTAGVTSSLTMGALPGSENNTFVTFDGVLQHKNTYSVVGTSITFSSAIPVGTLAVEIVRTGALDIGTPSDGTVSTAKIADEAVTTAKIDDEAVTDPKLGPAAVTAAKLAHSAVNGQTAETAPATGDELLLADVSAAALRKMTLANMLKVINALTEDTAPDAAADYLLSYDGSASGVKKVLLGRLGGWVLHSTQSASGSAVSFGSIPSWATEIEVTVVSLSTNGTNPVLLQLGDAGGYETADYLGSEVNDAGASLFSTGFADASASAAIVRHGAFTLRRHDAGTNTWTCHGGYGFSNAGGGRMLAGSKALSQALDSVRLSTADTFDGGTVTLRYRA